MKRLTIVLVALMLAAAPFAAFAHDSAHQGMAMAAAPAKTITGEVVDTGCYLDHAARGEKHASCASKCLAGGMPMGLLTSDGRLYLLTMNHDNPDPYNELKKMPGQTVAVTGKVMMRSGMKGIDVSSYKSAAHTTAR